MPYSDLALVYPVCLSRKHSPYVLESSWCLPVLQHRVFQLAMRRNGAHKTPGSSWWLVFMLLFQLPPASYDWWHWAGRKQKWHSANCKSCVCKMKQSIVHSKLLSTLQASWSTLRNHQTCKKTPDKGPWHHKHHVFSGFRQSHHK